MLIVLIIILAISLGNKALPFPLYQLTVRLILFLLALLLLTCILLTAIFFLDKMAGMPGSVTYGATTVLVMVFLYLVIHRFLSWQLRKRKDG